MIVTGHLEKCLAKDSRKGQGPKLKKEKSRNKIHPPRTLGQHVNLFGTYDFRDLNAANDNEFTKDEVLEFRVA